ncbi:sulfur carrier protein ThiS [Sciscionella marina]|uniref:sulfur carrier protein ThiS n=1 Tax=Sciscionella marina TaxID=508770 RepID=UPI0003684D8B|nr:sulfur carrier protein ThiS [Sciscionella marina]
MKVTANGQVHELREGALTELLDALGTPERGVAVAVDGRVVARGQWSETMLTEGAKIEILTAVQGG